MLAPWSAFWDRDLFISAYPSVRDVVQNSFVRGAVSGVGVLTVLAGLVEIAALFAARRPAEGGDHASV